MMKIKTRITKMTKYRENKGLALLLLAISTLVFAAGLKLNDVSAKEKKDEPTWTMTSFPDASGKQGMFYTLYNPTDQKLVVIDGGWKENEDQVRKVIKRYGGVVHAWILTHYHNDHIDAFNAIYENPKGIRIRNIYASPMDYAHYIEVAQPWDDVESFGKFLTLTQGASNVHYVKRDDRFRLAGLTFHFLNTYDKTLLKTVGESDLPNNGSLIFKVSGKQSSVLFCADAHSKDLADWLIEHYEKEIVSTCVQVGHHGNNSFPVMFYAMVNPKYAIFDAPAWLMTDHQYSSWKLERWCKENKIKTYDFRGAPNRFKIR